MITKALLETSIDGIGRLHKTPIFPCGIFQLMKGVNREEGDPNYDLYQLALRSTAQRLYPNYVNCDVTMQLNWVDYDRTCKQEVIDNLSDKNYKALVDRLADDPELRNKLMLDVVDDNLVVRQEQIPIEIMSTMGCRTQNGADINGQDSYKKNVMSVIKDGTLYDDFISCAQKDGRGNICPVTVIMPTLAMESVEKVMQQHSDMDLDTARECVSGIVSGEKTFDSVGIYHVPVPVFKNEIVEEFMELLDAKIGDAKDMLLERFEWICGQSPESAKFMYENHVMAGYVPDEGIRSALKHGTLALGQIGLAETLQILLGCDQTTDEGMKLAKRIEQLFKDRCAEYKEKYKLNFGVYYTPAENLCYTSMKKFKDTYGVIPNVSDKDYFTNSIHVPVWIEMNPFEKIDIESQLTGYSSAGCITYVELDASVKNNLGALETIVNYAMDKDIPYFAVNVPNDMCTNCGYTDDMDVCPMCGCTDIRRLRRVTGYLTGDYKTAFNKGKQQEVEMRVKHQRFS